jgi:putative redox protein
MPTITTTYQGDMVFETVLGRHRLLIDVPAGMGGKDRAPTPPELFVASLGSCVAAFVASYCQRVGLDRRELSVDVSYEKAEEPTRLVGLTVTVKLPHAACGDRQEAIRRVARHCPVHETIATLADVQFEIVDRVSQPA